VSSDATAADVNWGGGGLNNNINQVVAVDTLGQNDAVANFFDLNPAGPLANSGELNAIAARTACIRNRPVPNYLGGVSRGPADLTPPSGRNLTAEYAGCHIAMSGAIETALT
jgi:hypothetical protein